MKPSLSIPQLTPDDRLWRIDWFGDFLYPAGQSNSQPSFRVAISPVLCDPTDANAMLAPNATNLNNQRPIFLKVGLLSYIKIGDIWQNGQCVNTPDYQTERFDKLKINKTTTSIIKTGLSIDDEFILPLNEHPWHRQQTKSYCLHVMLPNQKRLIIPCVELIRFYFGSSSKLLHILFTRQISKDDFWKSMQFNTLTGHLHLKLATNISGMSAADIGRIALDKNAWRAARLIFDTCMAASAAHELIYPYLSFPFIGSTDLVATGKWISSGTAPDATFAVYSLKSCSHPFPFKSLSYEATDNKKVTAEKNKLTNQDSEAISQNIILNNIKIKSQTLGESDPGKSKSSKEYWTNGNPRFPDLTKKLVWRERYETNDPPAVIMAKGVAHDEQVGVGDSNGSNGNSRSIDIGQGLTRSQLSEIDHKKHKFVLDGIKLAIKQLKLRTDSTTTELITLPGYTHPVISLPYLVDEYGEINPISLCADGHGGERMRRSCFVEITESKKTLYRFFIIERKYIKDVVRAIDVGDFELRRAIEALIAYPSHNQQVIPMKGRTRFQQLLAKWYAHCEGLLSRN